MSKFKEGDLVMRTERGLTFESELTIGKSYKVLGVGMMEEIKLINDLGVERGYMQKYFVMDKRSIIYNILKDL